MNMKQNFGPVHCKPYIDLEAMQHRVHEPMDDGTPITFRWHWPRGTFDRRMSAREIAVFVLPFMPAMVGLLRAPRIQRDFLELIHRLVFWPTEALDEVVPWIRRLDYTEEDEILLLDLNAREVPTGPIHFVLGART
jgi:hypothetical protein